MYASDCVNIACCWVFSEYLLRTIFKMSTDDYVYNASCWLCLQCILLSRLTKPAATCLCTKPATDCVYSGCCWVCLQCLLVIVFIMPASDRVYFFFFIMYFSLPENIPPHPLGGTGVRKQWSASFYCIPHIRRSMLSEDTSVIFIISHCYSSCWNKHIWFIIAFMSVLGL